MYRWLARVLYHCRPPTDDCHCACVSLVFTGTFNYVQRWLARVLYRCRPPTDYCHCACVSFVFTGTVFLTMYTVQVVSSSLISLPATSRRLLLLMRLIRFYRYRIFNYVQVVSPSLVSLPATNRRLVLHLPAVLATLLLILFPIQMLLFILNQVFLQTLFRLYSDTDPDLSFCTSSYYY
jgi:hypothetical protein